MMTIVTPAVPNGRDIVLEDYRGGLPEQLRAGEWG
jgi:hypothetical protein